MILVTGGTGLVGIHLLMELCEYSELPIVATYRSEKTLANASKVFLEHSIPEKWEAICWLQADITDIPSLSIIFETHKISQVYHCAGYVTFQEAAFEQLKKVNIEGTANMVNLSVDHKVEKFCFVSSIATLNLNPGDKTIDETSKWNSEFENSGYAISKFGGEMEVWRGSEEGLSIIIVHPGVIIGKGFTKGSSEIFTKVKKGLLFYTLGSSGYISAFDVAKGMVRLMDSEIRNDNFILISENLPHKKVIDIIAHQLGRKAPKMKVSKIVVSIIAWLESLLSVFWGRNPQIPRDMVHSLFSETNYNTEKIQKALNFEFGSVCKSLLFSTNVSIWV